MKKFLSHSRLKDALTVHLYLANKLLVHAQLHGKKVAATWCTEVAATHCSLDYLSSTHEEADTKLISHALNAKVRGATKIFIFAQDTDVLVLALRRYDRLPDKSFVPDQHTLISIHDIASALGHLKTAALPGFHALSGCDSTGCLVGK